MICRLLAALTVMPWCVWAGLLITRTGDGLQFSEAVDLEINARNRVFALPGKPGPSPPASGLPAVRLGPTMIQDAETGAIVLYARGGEIRYVFPDGLPKKTPLPAAQAWQQSIFSYKAAPSEKNRLQLPGAEFVAYLAGGVEELADFCSDEDALRLAAADRFFQFRLELTARAISAYGSTAPMARLEREILAAMESRLARFERGIGGVAALMEGLQFAELSAAAFPGDKAHEAARARLAERKAWLDRRVAVLRALASGAQWDSFLLAYRSFERYQSSFPELAALLREALQSSLDTHWKRGKDLLARGSPRRAVEELRLASARRPSDAVLQKDLAIAWAEYSRQAAAAARAGRRSLSPGEREALQQFLHFAVRFREQNRLDDAMKSVLEAERIDSSALPVLLTKAEVLAARQEISAALAVLDIFDLHAVDEERSPGSKLRNDLLFTITAGLQQLRQQMESAWRSGRYYETRALARRGLVANPVAPDFLFYGGLASLVTRSPGEGAELLQKFLDASFNLDGDPKRRSEVYALLGSLQPDPPASEGQPNWFSGAGVPAGALYCPVSLAFQGRIERIEASGGMTVRFAWNENRLQGLQPLFEKPEQNSGEKPFFFGYHDQIPHVISVTAGSQPQAPPADPDALLAKSNVLLPNNPFFDPRMILRLTGRPAAMTVAPNRFFHPFVWQEPVPFALEYDEMGRIVLAREIRDAGGLSSQPVTASFTWDGPRLAAIRVSQPPHSGAQPVVVYERTMRYSQGRLIGEEIRAGARSSSIRYVWKGDLLASAECEKDETLDGRSRKVVFSLARPRST
jgi:hypothetical protein